MRSSEFFNPTPSPIALAVSDNNCRYCSASLEVKGKPLLQLPKQSVLSGSMALKPFCLHSWILCTAYRHAGSRVGEGLIVWCGP
jgi:hypothetical protein